MLRNDQYIKLYVPAFKAALTPSRNTKLWGAVFAEPQNGAI